MINIKGMLEVEKLCTEYLSARLLDSMSGEYSQDNQYVLLQLKIDLSPEQFVLADPLAVLPRVLVLVSLEGAVLSQFAPCIGISCWNPPQPDGSGRMIQRVHVPQTQAASCVQGAGVGLQNAHCTKILLPYQAWEVKLHLYSL